MAANAAATKYRLSSIGGQARLEFLVQLLKMRGRIDCDYQEMKDEPALNHYEGRNWRGFDHHGVLCVAA